MAVNCNRKNPLIRSGTGQDDRVLRSLQPAFIGVDERSLADLILFAQRFSQHLKYYNADNLEAGTWLPFFSQDTTAVLAKLSQLPVESSLKFYQNLQRYLSADPDRLPAVLSNHFKLVFHLPLLLLQEVSETYAILPQAHPLKQLIETVLLRDIETPLQSVIGYYKGVLVLDQPPINDELLFEDTPLNLADYNTTLDDSDDRIQLPTAVTERIQTSTTPANLAIHPSFIVGIAPTGWTTWYEEIAPNAIPYLDSNNTNPQVYNQIFDALNYNLLTTAIERLFQAFERITREAVRSLELSLTTIADHPAHYGLWLAFLRLFQLNQGHLNTLTERHLNYYYKEVLQLCLQKAVPDRVHLIFELAKNQQSRLLPAGTLFRAGKDALGNEVNYRLESDLVVNRAQVAALKSLYLKPLNVLGTNFLLPYAAPVTNSSDGLGEALSKEDPQWEPFDPAIGSPNARLGFALADRQFFLREGDRTITLVIKLSVPLPLVALSLGFKASLTAEDGWLEIADPVKLVITINTLQEIVIAIRLDGEAPAIIPYDPSLHGEEFTVSDPVVKIEFNFTQNLLWSTYFFTALKDIQFTSIKVKTFAQNVRNFTLQNDTGSLDASKPFLPFGAMPEVNTPLILGSSELFSKPLETLKIQVDWEKGYNSKDFFLQRSPSSYQLRLRYLDAGKWQSANDDVELFDGVDSSNSTLEIPQSKLALLSTTNQQTLENQPYTTTSPTGFVKLELNQNFGHKKYIDIKTLALINIANDPDWVPNTAPFFMTTLTANIPGNLSANSSKTDFSSYNFTGQIPRDPYTPKIIDISLSYQTVLTTATMFFHLYPFGLTQQSSSSGRLFPKVSHEGELYIGIKDLEPPQRLSLLFQTVDGTANPLKGETTVQWHYLRHDEWVLLKDQYLDDKTNNLTGSGIIGIVVPEDANTEHHLLPTGLHWFRLSVSSDADALNNLLSIQTQAAIATFVDQGNDPAFLATPLPAETIAKLKVSEAAIKKISQPYPSFGGEPPETDDHFYVRASERLRHKDRASTLWDYEHLVLEHFPNIYKVKCINHTQLQRDLNNNILADNEVKPGHVLVVTIPNIKDNPVVDPLRPYTDKKTIVAIAQFLQPYRISPFVQLEVQNPKFEDVQVKFKVAFTEDIADIAFYKAELNQAIIRFLSPWAFAEGADISFGGKWHKSAIINFVEERSYVEYVKDFEMYHKVDINQSDHTWNRIDEEVVEATTSRSILVSHREHDIHEIG